MSESVIDRGLVVVVIAVALALGVVAAMAWDVWHPRERAVCVPCDGVP
jgi:hypothetical protein